MASANSTLDQTVEGKIQAAGPKESVLLGSVFFFAVATYLATLRFDFVYDDRVQIVANTLVHAWRYVPQYFLGRTWHDGFENAAVNYYRPVNFVWLRANYALFGPHPHGWHATALLLHLLVTFLVYSVARHVTRRPLVAALTALIFGVHPMTHEVVAWVSGTTESLWTAFALGAFLSYLKFRETQRTMWWLASGALFALSVLSKETAITLPAIIFAHWCIYGSPSEGDATEPLRRRLYGAAKITALYLPVAAAYLVARVRILHGFSHPPLHVSSRVFLLTIPSIAFFYFKQWLLPIRPTEFYETPVSTAFSVTHVLVPIFGLVLIATALWLLRRKLGPREVAFASAWMVLPLLPALDFVVFPFGEIVHDRYFYLPSFGAALLAALALEKLAYGPLVFGIPRRLAIVTLGLVLVLSAVTANAASYWSDDFTLFEHAYRLAPHSTPPRINYAIELISRGESGSAIPILEQVLKEFPENYLATYALGRALYEAGILKASEHFFERAEQLNPDMAGTYLYLGLIEMKTMRVDQAVGSMRRALALEPLEPGYHFALGMVLQQQGSCTESRSELREALDLQPGFPHAAEQIGKCGASASNSAPATPVSPAASSQRVGISVSAPSR